MIDKKTIASYMDSIGYNNIEVYDTKINRVGNKYNSYIVYYTDIMTNKNESRTFFEYDIIRYETDILDQKIENIIK